MTLVEFLLAITVAVALTIAGMFFMGIIAIAGLRAAMFVASVILLWAVLYSLAPEMTRTFTALLLVGVLVLGVVPGMMLRSREAARRNQCRQSLHQTGMKMQDAFQTPAPSPHGPTGRPPDSPGFPQPSVPPTIYGGEPLPDSGLDRR